MNKVIKASGNTVEGYWPGLFVRALKGADIGSILSNVGSMGGGGGAAAADAGAGAGDAPAAEKKEEKKEEPEEDVDMGDLFGGGDDDY